MYAEEQLAVRLAVRLSSTSGMPKNVSITNEYRGSSVAQDTIHSLLRLNMDH